MAESFQVRIDILTRKDGWVESLIADGLQNKAGRQILLERLGPQLKPILDECTRRTKEIVLEAYRTPGFVPGDTLRMAFLGGYGESVQRRFRAQTTQTWPWAYVGLYPQPGADTLQSRNPAIYIPSIETGMTPAGWTDFQHDGSGRRKSTGTGGWMMFQRLAYWARKKLGVDEGTRRGHTFVWLLYKKILERGTRAKYLFRQVEDTPEFQKFLQEKQKRVFNAIRRAFLPFRR